MFLSILATIGIILLIILAVIVVLVLLFLFLPFKYRIQINGNGKFTAKGRVSWLLRAVSITFSFDKEFDWNIRILGISLKKFLMGRASSGRSKGSAPRAKKQPTIKPGQKIKDGKKAEQNRARIDINIDKLNTENKPETAAQADVPKFEEEEEKTPLTEKIRFTFNRICDIIKKLKSFKELFDKIKPDLFAILKEIRPKKIKGDIVFGFEDPSTTGKLLALISVFIAFIPEELKITPDFTAKRFEGEVIISGRFRIFILLKHGLRILKNKKVRKLIKKLRK